MREQEPERVRGDAPRRERGFALLLVFALAASLAILIYLEIPRVAFERQRDKEALLIDRGEQYERAIELYTRKMNKNPQTLDDLEHSQTVRFLRRRYKDPMTGKDEWRLVHVNANGQYVDSKVHKAGGALDKQDSGPSILASKIQGVGQSATIISQEAQASAALQKRASDRISPGGPGGSGGSSGDASQNGAAGANPDPNQDPNQPQYSASEAGRAAAAGGSTGANAQNAAGSGGPAATPVFGSVLPQAQQDAGGNTSAPGGASQSQAMQAVQSILGSSRSSSSSSSSSSTSSSASASGTGSQAGGGPTNFGAGLVGVATTVEMEGIRRYKDHSNYSEWEFVYDPNEAKGQGGQGQAGSGTGTQQGATANAGGNAGASSALGGMPGGVPAPPASAPPNN